MFKKVSQHSGVVFQAVLWCLSIGVLFQNVRPMRQNVELRARLETDQTTLTRVDVGNSIKVVSGADMMGTATNIAADQRKTLVITFSPSCPICKGKQG